MGDQHVMFALASFRGTQTICVSADAVHASYARSVCRALHDELTAFATWHPYRRNLGGTPVPAAEPGSFGL